MNRSIALSAKDDREAGPLMTTPGVAYYGALSIRSEIRDVNRSASANQLYRYAGPIPSTYQPAFARIPHSFYTGVDGWKR